MESLHAAFNIHDPQQFEWKESLYRGLGLGYNNHQERSFTCKEAHLNIDEHRFCWTRKHYRRTDKQRSGRTREYGRIDAYRKDEYARTEQGDLDRRRNTKRRIYGEDLIPLVKDNSHNCLILLMCKKLYLY